MTEPATSHRANIEDVARFAGVSRAAVSKVIRDAYGVSADLRTRVESAIEQLGYPPRISARAMRGSAYTLGVALPAHPLVSLTSIDQSGTQIGEIVARMLLERIAGRTDAVHEVITPRLIRRRSSASAPWGGVRA